MRKETLAKGTAEGEVLAIAKGEQFAIWKEETLANGAAQTSD